MNPTHFSQGNGSLNSCNQNENKLGIIQPGSYRATSSSSNTHILYALNLACQRKLPVISALLLSEIASGGELVLERNETLDHYVAVVVGKNQT